MRVNDKQLHCQQEIPVIYSAYAPAIFLKCFHNKMITITPMCTTHTHTHTHTLGQGFQMVTYNILSYLDDARSLCRAEQVCRDWYRVVGEGLLWKKLIKKKMKTDSVWRGLSERRGW